MERRRVYSFMPLFIVGFLFTAGPRWLGLSDVPARAFTGFMTLMDAFNRAGSTDPTRRKTGR